MEFRNVDNQAGENIAADVDAVEHSRLNKPRVVSVNTLSKISHICGGLL